MSAHLRLVSHLVHLLSPEVKARAAEQAEADLRHTLQPTIAAKISVEERARIREEEREKLLPKLRHEVRQEMEAEMDDDTPTEAEITRVRRYLVQEASTSEARELALTLRAFDIDARRARAVKRTGIMVCLAGLLPAILGFLASPPATFCLLFLALGVMGALLILSAREFNQLSQMRSVALERATIWANHARQMRAHAASPTLFSRTETQSMLIETVAQWRNTKVDLHPDELARARVRISEDAAAATSHTELLEALEAAREDDAEEEAEETARLSARV